MEVTTFRRDHRYGDHRRPDRGDVHDDLTEDLARRDFTINAMAYGPRGPGRPRSDGRTDLARRLVRARGRPGRPLRRGRAAAPACGPAGGRSWASSSSRSRAARSGGPRPCCATSRPSGGAASCSGCSRGGPAVSGLRLLDETGLLEALSPDLAAQRGVPQAKVPGHDLWAHTLRTVDAAAVLRAWGRDAAPGRPAARHRQAVDAVGGPLLRATRWPAPRSPRAGCAAWACRDARSSRWAAWCAGTCSSTSPAGAMPPCAGSSAASARRRCRSLLLLRRADAIGSGDAPDARSHRRAPARIGGPAGPGTRAAQLADLAVDGDDVLARVGRPPGAWLGRLLGRLLASVLADPSRNTRATLLADAPGRRTAR